jgi:energy-coupling factor transport system permease protein
VLGADAQRLAEAQRTRPAHPARGIRGRVALLSAIVGGSLERSMEVAATLELRGFAVAAERPPGPRWPRLPGTRRRQGPRAPGSGTGSPGSPARRSQARARRPWSRHDLAFLCSAFAVLALALGGRLTGAASFSAYPLVQMQLDTGTFVLSAALLAAILLPFLDRRGIDR